MKKILIVVSIILSVLLVAAFTLPVIFKDDIKAAIDEEIKASVNADVLFDVDDFSLSLFTNFPNITASMKNFGVVNRAPFEGEVLFAAEAFEVEINLFSVLFDDTPRLSGISLIRPIINVKVLEDGTANYDIAVPAEEVEIDTVETSSEFSFAIDHWEMVDAELVYDDKTIPFYMKMIGFDHSGSGDFTQDVFDLRTNSSIDSLWVGYDGDMYLEEKSVNLEATITISDDVSKYTFKENKASINDFSMAFDGWFFMGSDFYDMDITYEAVDNSFKSLLSLVPGMYSSDFGGMETEGTLSFSGALKGKYTDTEMPAFNVALLVENGMFKYPDLPTAVENIAMDMKVNNPDGIIENTSVDISVFHMDLGKNPIDAVVSIANLSDYKTKANLKAKLDLGDLNTMFPVEGLDMKGIFTMDMTAEGTYDSTMKTMPVMNGSMGLNSGYIKSSEFPLPMENMNFQANLTNSTGKMKDFTAKISDFAMVLDKEKFTADVLFSNLDNYTWDINAGGAVDLEKITKIFPLEGMELAGKIQANLKTSGNYALVEQEKYDQLPTSGNLSVTNFVYKDVTLPYDVTISKASGNFSPSIIHLTEYNGTVGKSDMAMNGKINNYMGYIFNENELLTGTFDFKSKFLDLNELMPESEEETVVQEDTTTYQVIPIPKNIDFVLNSTIDKLKFMDLEVNNAKGNIIIRDGVANLNDITFNMLGGSFLMAGAYDTKDPAKPGYDFKMKIDNLGIRETYEAFTIVKVLAPLAKTMTGKLSTDFSISGLLE
ncbi:MAG: AsmA family protein, partial [Cyclobacteriaceae bacterium]|nr:AsmA family protein [Cyclobacteriaceae bacterium]